MNQQNTSPLRILVTGGTGFLGQNIIKELHDQTFMEVNEILNLDVKRPSGEIERLSKHVQGDIRDYETVRNATQGIDAVIHAAAIVDWGTHSPEKVYEVNFTGTENIINACRENDVKYLVYTSTLDVVINGEPLVDIDESQPYPDRSMNMYCESKMLAEKAVINANLDGLKTSILRPSDIYGEGDPYHIDSLINMAKTGFYIRLGNGRSKCQHVYVGNMAWAHIQLLHAMTGENRDVLGQVYFITDGPSANFFSFFDQFVHGSGYKIWPKNLWIPEKLALFMGASNELVAWLLRPVFKTNPKFSRFAVFYTCTDFTFSAEKAIRDFGFLPKYDQHKSLARTIEHYRNS
jgi:nucleoside-diphosphate-sugar epimerase